MTKMEATMQKAQVMEGGVGPSKPPQQEEKSMNLMMIELQSK